MVIFYSYVKLPEGKPGGILSSNRPIGEHQDQLPVAPTSRKTKDYFSNPLPHPILVARTILQDATVKLQALGNEQSPILQYLHVTQHPWWGRRPLSQHRLGRIPQIFEVKAKDLVHAVLRQGSGGTAIPMKGDVEILQWSWGSFPIIQESQGQS